MRTLVLVRHAKSDYPPGVSDHDRPLSPRGERDAPVIGRWISEHGLCPQVALVSTAERTRQTWSSMAPFLGDVPVVWEPRIYEASRQELLGVLAGVPEDFTCVMMVGHNPGMEDFALSATAGSVNEARARMAEKFPTSAVAVLTSDDRWSQWGSAELSSFVVPRG